MKKISKYLKPIRSLRMLSDYTDKLSNLMDKKRLTHRQRIDFKLLVWQIERYEAKIFGCKNYTPISMIEMTK